MKRMYPCGALEHRLARRSLLAGLVGGGCAAMGLSRVIQPAVAETLQRNQKRVLVVYFNGGLSQLESWDPKPNTETGGPFRAIPTTVPGVHISELLPYTAQQMHHLTIVRSVNTAEDDHGRGRVFMETGRPQSPAAQYPVLGSAVARLLADDAGALPGYIHIRPGGAGYNKADAAFLGPKYAALATDGSLPANIARPGDLPESADAARQALRRQLDAGFTRRRRTADTEAYTFSYEQAAEMMRQTELFDVSREPEADQQRYGSHDFGRHCLLARRLLEHGFTCVKLSHSEYDTHFENFDFHLEQLGEFDRPFATLIADLADRGLLEHTLVVLMSEFGRTPNINYGLGRDHWGHAWSVVLGGCGIQPGGVVGKTNEQGTAVVDRQVDGRHLFHTYMRALGLDPTRNYLVDGREIPVADPSASAIDELLA
jgi:uncharacterized protein (DUF1501 family)